MKESLSELEEVASQNATISSAVHISSRISVLDCGHLFEWEGKRTIEAYPRSQAT